MDREMGWLLKCSARAAHSSSSRSEQFTGLVWVTAKEPRVRVPVLSITTTPVLARASR